MEAWLNGNPSPFLDLYSEDFTYFDPSQEWRLDGRDKINPLSSAVSGHLPVFPVRRSNKPFRLFSAGFGRKKNICVSFRRTFAACNFRIKYDKEIDY
jgi:hypothetical protein